MNSDFEYVNCPVCQKGEHTKLYEISYFNEDILSKIGVNDIPDKTYLCHCHNCDQRYSNPQLSNSSLDEYYTQINSEYYIEREDFTDKLLLQHKHVLLEVEKKINHGTVLEIGCGNGFLLSLFDKKRWDSYGVEPFSPAAMYAETKLGLKVITGYLDKETFPQGKKFDVILLFDVIEHLKDPNSMIDLIRFYLKPEGLLVIGTGDISRLNAHLSGRHWSYITLREHLAFYSKKSMKYLLSDFSTVDIEDVSYIGDCKDNLITFLASHLVRRFYNLFQSSHYWLTKYTFTRFPHVRYISSFDHMLVIAKK